MCGKEVTNLELSNRNELRNEKIVRLYNAEEGIKEKEWEYAHGGHYTYLELIKILDNYMIQTFCQAEGTIFFLKYEKTLILNC